MDKASPRTLLRRRRFGPFFATQFLGAFNDNVFKNALLILIAYTGARGEAAMDESVLVNMAAGLFVLPFFLFSALAGQLADKYEKARVIRLVKIAEIAIMLAAAAAFLAGSIAALIAILFLMGAQSTFFGPVKYGILPEHLADTELVGGNGLVETGTFLAILIGTLVGGMMVAEAGAAGVAVTVVALAALGYASSLFIPATPAADAALRLNWNPVSETRNCVRYAAATRTVLLSVMGISWFWFLGALYLAQLPVYTRVDLGADERVVTILLATFSVGIGAGSMLCERLSGRRVELGLVPLGSIGLTLFGADLFFASPGGGGEPLGPLEFVTRLSSWRVILDLGLIGLFGGLYIVPLYALVQQRSDPAVRSRVIAANNIINALFMVVAALLAAVLLGPGGFSIPGLFLLAAILNAVVAVYIYTVVPEFLMRFLVWVLISTLYRVRVQGRDRIPDKGPAVLVCNHVSFVDALVIAGSIRRPVRFVMDHRIFRIPVLNFVFRTAGAIPIAPAREDEALLANAMEAIDAALAAGELVCVFPEGGLTHTGEIGEFRRGVERIVARRPVPVVPMALQGLWGSLFSRRDGPPSARLPRKLWARVGLAIGAPVGPAEAGADRLRDDVASLRGGHR